MGGVAISPQDARQYLSHCGPNFTACLRTIAFSVRFIRSTEGGRQ